VNAIWLLNLPKILNLEFDMIVKIELKTDFANSYVDDYLTLHDLGEELSLVIENPSRVIRVDKRELAKAIAALID
jgi:parvulin-like peptidyl-prolyl isomerase